MTIIFLIQLIQMLVVVLNLCRQQLLHLVIWWHRVKLFLKWQMKVFHNFKNNSASQVANITTTKTTTLITSLDCHRIKTTGHLAIKTTTMLLLLAKQTNKTLDKTIKKEISNPWWCLQHNNPSPHSQQTTPTKAALWNPISIYHLTTRLIQVTTHNNNNSNNIIRV